jgi:hypothetical protein
VCLLGHDVGKGQSRARWSGAERMVRPGSRGVRERGAGAGAVIGTPLVIARTPPAGACVVRPVSHRWVTRPGGGGEAHPGAPNGAATSRILLCYGCFGPFRRAVCPGRRRTAAGPPPDPGEAAVTAVHARGGRVTSRRRPRRGPAARCPAGGGIRASSGAGGGAHRPRGAPLPEPLPEAAGTALPQISTPRPPRTHRCWRCVFTQRPGNRCVPAVPRPFRGRAAAVSSRVPRNYRQGPPVEMQSPHVAHCGRNPTARGGAVRAAPGPSCRPGAARPPAPPQAGAPTALRTLPVVR